jgi:hypothetical protein
LPSRQVLGEKTDSLPFLAFVITRFLALCKGFFPHRKVTAAPHRYRTRNDLPETREKEDAMGGINANTEDTFAQGDGNGYALILTAPIPAAVESRR